MGQPTTLADPDAAGREVAARPVALLEGGFLDAAKVAKLVGLFVEELPSRAKSIEEALGVRDSHLLKELAHQLKGASATYGFVQIADAAHVIHRQVQEEEGWEQLQECVAELVRLCQQASSQSPGKLFDATSR